MKIVLFTTDLMAASKIAAPVGAELCTVAGREQLLVAAPTARLLVIDLNSLDSGIRELIANLKSAAPTARIIAFGPHVHEAKLQAARDAGCDAVFTRGQFHANTVEILNRFL